MAVILANATPVPARTHSRCHALDHPGQPIYHRSVQPCDGFTRPGHRIRKPLCASHCSRLAVALLLALSGCHLLDQTDFEPKLAETGTTTGAEPGDASSFGDH